MCTGVRRMIDLCREQGLPEPEYQSDGYTVKIVFWKTTQKSESTTQKATQKKIEAYLSENHIKLSKNQLQILLELNDNGNLTRKELMLIHNDITSDGIQYILSRLQELGLLRREGGRKNGKWIVTIKSKKEKN
jgi:ATP-dependent DNA helicase RecG